ncbi:major facilitator superfamily domain-containing protein [Phascolomyces articulosus]|uniref:Major facilitator superfamily domain-containing protein n=1 Tax=Phascolomyces articulosus TaxID=60185 RepID=A0AAD5K216_9FUNG|nr:major facilitator superfamily domain-containing protein [Phascolomyces articulosus]
MAPHPEDNDEKAEVVHADSSETPDSDSTNAEKGGFQQRYVKSEAEKRYLRKVNIAFIPLVTWIVMVQFADKASLAISAVLGIYDDTGITGSQFSWLGSIFFLGYLIMQIPNQILVQKMPIKRYLGVCIIIFGAIMLFTAMANKFQELLALRFLLGLFEATCLPCIYIIVPNLYRREEQTFYFGVVTMCQGVGSILGNLVAVGVSQMGGDRLGLAMWRWNHIIFGAFTVFLGILCFFFLLDDPRSWVLRLTEEEHKIVDKRTQDNAVIRNKEIKYKHFIEAIKEPRLYLIGIASICINMQNGGLLVFSAQLIRTLGDFTPTESILLKMPGGVAASIFIITASIIARRIRQIAYTGMVMCLISLAGVIILAAAPHGAIKLLGYYLSWAMGGAGSLFIVTVGTNVSGYSKKIFYNSVLVIFTTVGNFIGPLVMLEREIPTYKTGMIVYCIGNAIAFLCFFIARTLMARENKKRLENPPTETLDVNGDYTDQEDRSFIYKL